MAPRCQPAASVYNGATEGYSVTGKSRGRCAADSFYDKANIFFKFSREFVNLLYCCLEIADLINFTFINIIL